jgi:hypothetical protein
VTRIRLEMLDEGALEIAGDSDGLRALANDLLEVAVTGETIMRGLVDEDEVQSLTIYLLTEV